MFKIPLFKIPLYRLLLIVSLLAVTSCAAAPVKTAPASLEPQRTALEKTTRGQPDSLNVSIIVFQAGNFGDSPDKLKSQFQARLRNAESNYLPVVLRKTLVDSMYWGAVRVLPADDPTAEVLVTAEIMRSDAVELRLRVRVRDSRGVVWLDKVYAQASAEHAFDSDDSALTEPYQDLYNRVANDMLAVRRTLSASEVSAVLDIATLRYAIALSPQAFSGYLVENGNGIVEVSRLPARDDPMYNRVRKIREAEYRFIDTMDDQYDTFFEEMQRIYPYWRRYSYELVTYNRSLEQAPPAKRRSANNRWEELDDVYKTYKDFKLNEDALRELADSFDSEIQPTVSELEGTVIELSGSLHAQYDEWRRILRQIYATETGL